MRNCKLIAVDLDGTLVRNDQTISAHTQEVMVRVQQQGVKVMIASGRPTYGTRAVAETLRLAEFGGYVMSYNGGEIHDWQTRKVLHTQTLDSEVLPFLDTCARQHGFPIMTYVGQNVVSEVEDNEYVRYSSRRNGMPILRVPRFLEAIHEPVGKCIIVGDPAPLQKLEATLRKQLLGRAGVFRSEPFFLEVVPLGIDKANGLRMLLGQIGVAREELMAFGDGYNDIPMLQFAGLGVAMENAEEPIKKAADFVTRSNEADGVAYAIEQFVCRSIPLQDKPC